MSPKSRGRKGRKTGNKRPQHPGRSNRSSPRHEDSRGSASYPQDPVAPHTTPGPDVGATPTKTVNELLDTLLTDGPDLLVEDDALGAQLAATRLITSGDRELEFDPALDWDVGEDEVISTETALTTALLPPLEQRGDRRSLAYLLALASVASEPAAGAARRAAGRLTRAGVAEPDWAADLREPLTPTRCFRIYDDADVASALVCECSRGTRSQALIVTVDDTDCHAADDVWVVNEEGAERVLTTLKENAAAAEITLRTEDLDAAEFRWQAERALHARAIHDAPATQLGLPPWAGESPFDEPWEPDLPFDLDSLEPESPFSDDDPFDDGLFDDDPSDDDDDLFHDFDLGADDEADVDAEDFYHVMARLLAAHLPLLPASDKGPGRHEDAMMGPIAAAPLGESLAGDATTSAQPDRGLASVTLLPRRGGQRTTHTYRIKVGIRGAKPPIWRRLEVPGDIRLDRLHHVIQTAFEWYDEHLHVFETPYGEFGHDDPGMGIRAEGDVTLNQVAPEVGSTIRYVYDFGDDWQHDIRVEAIEPTATHTLLPRCTGGRRAAPPEDCGGIWGYGGLLDALDDPSHPDYEDLVAMLDVADPGDFDPAAFDRNAVTTRLQATSS